VRFSSPTGQPQCPDDRGDDDQVHVFGMWAVISGALQVSLAVRRRHAGVHGQWLMILSGAGSLVAGITFIGWVGTSHTALTTVAQYSAGGAVWYVLTVLWLAFTARQTQIT
jgi:uncharacterized membrane protein HdeD (DUF308 family)